MAWQSSLQGHQPSQSQNRLCSFLISGGQQAPHPKGCSYPLRMEMQERSLDLGRHDVLTLQTKPWLCAGFLEISWIHEVSDVIQENAPKF